jgi:hypothetical protein
MFGERAKAFYQRRLAPGLELPGLHPAPSPLEYFGQPFQRFVGRREDVASLQPRNTALGYMRQSRQFFLR